MEHVKHLLIKVDDSARQVLIIFASKLEVGLKLPRQDMLRHFAETNRFIEEALSKRTEQEPNGAAILVHCYMGVSRSATIVAAYGTSSPGGLVLC